MVLDKKKDEASDIYSYAFKLTLNEGSVLWNSSNGFLIANTIIVAIIANILPYIGEKNNPLILLGIAIIGFLISLLWFLSYRRRSDYYKFHIAQAKEVEPPSWKLLADKGERFANGEIVHIGEAHYQLGRLSRIRTNRLMTVFISIFLLAYIILCTLSLFLLF